MSGCYESKDYENVSVNSEKDKELGECERLYNISKEQQIYNSIYSLKDLIDMKDRIVLDLSARICELEKNYSRLDIIEVKIKEIESHLNKLHDMINIEDRITACDVLNRLTLLESSKLNQELDPKVWVYVNERLDKLETFGTDINLRLIHKAVETHIEKFNERLSKIENCFSSVIESGKKIKISEYKSVAKNCTICEGNGMLEGQYDCPKCLGKGKYI